MILSRECFGFFYVQNTEYGIKCFVLFNCLLEMGVLPELSKAVQEMDWILPTDIQSEAVPLILGGGDVLMAAETGSGKTGAFCLPVLQIVYETLKLLQSNKQV